MRGDTLTEGIYKGAGDRQDQSGLFFSVYYTPGRWLKTEPPGASPCLCASVVALVFLD